MPEHKSFKPLWETLPSGLTVPQGTESNFSTSSTQTYLQIKEEAIAVEKLYAESKVPLPESSDLAKLISEAKKLSDAWLLGNAHTLAMSVLFRAVLLDRINTAVLLLRDVEERSDYLRALTSGSLDLLDRQKSKAKDILWELELWSMLIRRSFDATLEEPPDIVVRFEDAKIGIACKKLYSERHVQNVLSQAVGQIESTFDFGIVAVCLDDLLPANRLLRTPTQDTMAQFISDLNARFLKSHERHFRKYLSSGRLISAFVSTGVLADVYGSRPQFHHARQSTIWTIPGLSMQKEKALSHFYKRLME